MIGTAVLVLVGLLLALLLWPVRYGVSFERWRLGIRISLLSGLWAKEIEFAKDKKEEIFEDEPPAKIEEPSAIEIKKEKPLDVEVMLQAAEEAAGKEEVAPSREEDISEEEDEPSLWTQIRFAIHNGLAERLFAAVSSLLSHSFPKKWQVSGEFGTGDPATTGMAGGMAAAFTGSITKNIAWNYLEPVNTLQGRCDGRIIPIYVLYIAGRLAFSKPLWEFLKFRKGKHHG